jgi:ABC-type bacteriocin/lantibiotic exporter with double-glycine peptidase domain
LLIAFSFFWIVVALTVANARILALEAEVNSARGAWEGANATKVAVEKASKSVEIKAKKAEKALADTDQKRVQREQAIAERLDKISVIVGSKCHVIPFGYSFRLVLADISLLSFACFFVVQQRKLESLGNFSSPILKIPC